MPRWDGALTWRCGFPAGRRRWSSGSWGRSRSATGRRRSGCPGPRSGHCWPTCWSTPAGWCRPTGWSRTCGATTRRATRPTPSRAGCRPCAGPWARPGRGGWSPARPATGWTPTRSSWTRPGSSAWSPRPRRPGRPTAPRAAGCWRRRWGCGAGPALAEFADAPWAQAEAARLEELRLAAREALVELRLAAGGHAGLVGELEGLVAAHPTRERLRGQLMVALYRSGRQADALALYRQTREVLAEELGIDPSPELQRLHQAILVQDPALEAARPDRGQPRHNLPERLTSLVGREEELAEVAKLVEQHRLVTVTGPGGAGKTTVATELARRLVGGYPDGVWLVELAALARPGPAGRGRGRRPGAGRGGRPAGRRRRRPRPTGWPPSSPTRRCCWSWTTASTWSRACAGLVQRLLEAGPAVRVLATSRELLGVPGGGHLAGPAPGRRAADAGRRWQRRRPGVEVLAGYDAVRLFARTGGRRRPRLRPGGGQRGRGGRAVPAAGRAAAGHRAGRGQGPGAAPGRDPGPARRPVPAAGRRRPDGRRPPADPAGHGRLELGAA